MPTSSAPLSRRPAFYPEHSGRVCRSPFAVLNFKFFGFAVSLFSLFPLPALAQPGCPDPQAINYAPSAAQNDGSCLYPTTTYAPVLKANLTADLREISGLTRSGGRWWGHADSGANPEFFNLNPENGQILQKISLQNAHNRDWEDVAADSAQLYFGDFGNNFNNRQDLGLYRVPLAKIGTSNSESVAEGDWQFVPFAYADQTDFSAQPEDSSVYDCEAAIFFRGKIHLFTKSRKTYRTAHYVVNEATGKAEKLEEFNTDGLITGASLSPDGQVVALLGYDLRSLIPKVFVWLLWDWQPGGSGGGDLLFSGNKRRIELGTALAVGQAEGIGFADKRRGYLCNERTDFNGITLAKEATRWFDISTWVPESVGVEEQGRVGEMMRVFPNPFAQTLHVQFFGNERPDVLRVLSGLGQTMFEASGDLPATLDTSHWPAGVYVVEGVFSGKKMMVGRVVCGN